MAAGTFHIDWATYLPTTYCLDHSVVISVSCSPENPVATQIFTIFLPRYSTP